MALRYVILALSLAKLGEVVQTAAADLAAKPQHTDLVRRLPAELQRHWTDPAG